MRDRLLSRRLRCGLSLLLFPQLHLNNLRKIDFRPAHVFAQVADVTAISDDGLAVFIRQLRMMASGVSEDLLVFVLAIVEFHPLAPWPLRFLGKPGHNVRPNAERNIHRHEAFDAAQLADALIGCRIRNYRDGVLKRITPFRAVVSITPIFPTFAVEFREMIAVDSSQARSVFQPPILLLREKTEYIKKIALNKASCTQAQSALPFRQPLPTDLPSGRLIVRVINANEFIGKPLELKTGRPFRLAANHFAKDVELTIDKCAIGGPVPCISFRLHL